jgi:maltose operon protein
MKNRTTLLSLLLGSLLTGCASTSPVETQVVIEPIPYNQLCCTRFAEMPFIQLSANETLAFKLGDDADAAAFSDGNSYFSAFQFAERSGIVNIQLSSTMSNGEVFAPKVVMLDAAFNQVDETTLDQFDIKASDAFTSTRYTASFKIDARKTPYIVIYTPEEYLGKTIKVDHPAKVRAKELGEAMPMATDPSYTHGHNGELELVVKTQSISAIKRAAQPVVVQSAPASQSEKTVETQVSSVLPDTINYYHTAIRQAVEQNDIAKALSLLEEAKALNVADAQKVFVSAVNALGGQ